jgi:hydrogenase maturation protein HypF
MLNGKLNAPETSSGGRLFDGVASLIGLRQKIRFEGQAAMELEFLIDEFQTDESYHVEISNSDLGAAVIDWSPMVKDIISDTKNDLSKTKIAAKFHNTLVAMILDVARLIGEKKIALSGGCFQNKYLLERAVRLLRREDFEVYWHQRVPTNDGGIALGQTFAAMINSRRE